MLDPVQINTHLSNPQHRNFERSSRSGPRISPALTANAMRRLLSSCAAAHGLAGIVQVSALALVFCLAIVLANLSLRFIPVSFNQARLFDSCCLDRSFCLFRRSTLCLGVQQYN